MDGIEESVSERMEKSDGEDPDTHYRIFVKGMALGTAVAGAVMYFVTSVAGVCTDDCNRDGREDIAISHPDGSRSVYLRQEDGSYVREGE